MTPAGHGGVGEGRQGTHPGQLDGAADERPRPASGPEGPGHGEVAPQEPTVGQDQVGGPADVAEGQAEAGEARRAEVLPGGGLEGAGGPGEGPGRCGPAEAAVPVVDHQRRAGPGPGHGAWPQRPAGSGPTRTSILPRLVPSKRPRKASGRRSNPSKTVLSAWTRPSASQRRMAASKAGRRAS